MKDPVGGAKGTQCPFEYLSLQFQKQNPDKFVSEFCKWLGIQMSGLDRWNTGLVQYSIMVTVVPKLAILKF
jgi:hypothetical protein